MSRKWVGILAPLGTAAVVVVFAFLFCSASLIRDGIVVGMALALIQSFASTAALQWAWKKKFFYWVWGSGVIVRMLIFGGTAVVIYRFTNLNLVATMITMVTATTGFLVIESMAFFSNIK